MTTKCTSDLLCNKSKELALKHVESRFQDYYELGIRTAQYKQYGSRVESFPQMSRSKALGVYIIGTDSKTILTNWLTNAKCYWLVGICTPNMLKLCFPAGTVSTLPHTEECEGCMFAVNLIVTTRQKQLKKHYKNQQQNITERCYCTEKYSTTNKNDRFIY